MKPDQLSQTAAFIAVKFYGLTQMEPYRSWFDEEVITFYDELVAALPAPPRWYHSPLKNRWIRSFFLHSEELLLPGDLMHILCRKYFIGQEIDKLLGSRGHYQQLLVLGAGFDHLAPTYAGRGIPSVEIDTPYMQQLKRQFLRETGRYCPGLFIHSEENPTTKKSLELSAIEGLRSDRRTVIVAEGFFDYLTAGHSRMILEGLSTYFKQEIVLISTVFDLSELSSFRELVFSGSIALVGERLKLHFNKEEYDSLIRNAGFKSRLKTLNSRTMRKKLLNPHGIKLPVLDGFYLTLHKSNG